MINNTKVGILLFVSKIRELGATLAAFLIWALAGYALFGIGAVVFAIYMVISVLAFAFGIVYGGREEDGFEILFRYRRHVISDEDEARAKGFLEFYQLVGEVSEEAGLARRPDALVIPVRGLQAKMITRPVYSRAVIVTEGLIDALSRKELKAVVAHEIFHALDGGRGLRLACLVRIASVLVGLSCFVPAIAYVAGGASELMDVVFATLVAYASVCIIGPRLQALVLQQREVRSDLYAAKTVDNESLASALEMCADPDDLLGQDPVEKVLHFAIEENQHPSIEARVKYLRAIGK